MYRQQELMLDLDLSTARLFRRGGGASEVTLIPLNIGVYELYHFLVLASSLCNRFCNVNLLSSDHTIQDDEFPEFGQMLAPRRAIYYLKTSAALHLQARLRRVHKFHVLSLPFFIAT